MKNLFVIFSVINLIMGFVFFISGTSDDWASMEMIVDVVLACYFIGLSILCKLFQE